MSEIAGPADSASAEDFADLYDNAPCGYLTMGPEGSIARANGTLCGWTGYSSAQLATKRWRDLLTFGSRIFYETHTAPLLNLQGLVNEVSLELRTADGATLPVFCYATQRRGGDRRLQATRLILVRANERRRYEQQLIEARNAADLEKKQSQELEATTRELLTLEREASVLREQFIAVLGHDLRNPLASISGGVSLLKKEQSSERGRLILGMIQGSVVRMSGLIDNVLDFARGRLGGGISLSRGAGVDIEPVLQQVVDELRVGVRDRLILTEFALTRTVDCDPSRFGQMVSNLVGNALTHGAPDQPVRVSAVTADGVLEVAVANGGRAIPQETLERLFQPFYRGQASSSRQGLGLGLHIASEIASAHGGTLSVRSSDEETRFTIRIPCD